MNNYPSILLSDAVEQVASLPGIGRKTALRLVLHLLRQPTKDVEAFTGAISKLKQEVQYCRVCHTISDQEVCPICQSHSRDKHTVCVVENDDIHEVILALPTTMEGDTTNFYIYRRLLNIKYNTLKISQIARGVAIGNELEYTDEITLGRSIVNRIEFKL